jgi:hypothetical protein
MTALNHLSITARGCSLWTCMGCGGVAFGDTATIEFTTNDPDSVGAELQHRLKHMPRAHMPIGWASWGADGVTCPDCTTRVRYDKDEGYVIL